MLAFALRADGWYLRQEIIWAKPNPMPESVTDRCTKSHEQIFLLAKSPTYYFDAEAMKEPSVTNDPRRPYTSKGAKDLDGRSEWKSGQARDKGDFSLRNKRSVWTVTTKPFKGAHFATFPTELIEPCILAGAPAGGIVLDPFFGSGTTGQVAQALGRQWIGCELNTAYKPLQDERLRQPSLLLEAA
jgi:site-specific DNA-methyltransferase (cytosine-N4-specific)